ncbi:MAG: hypothetical protein ACRDT8_05290 [Micromonosporaceae bacterium]
MPQVDLVEETFLAADLAMVCARLATVAFARQIWPDLRLRVAEDRGVEGLRFMVHGERVGSAEVWLQEWADGVIAHIYLRIDRADRKQAERKQAERKQWPRFYAERRSARDAARELARRQREIKSALWAIKDELEGSRRPGEAARR